MKNFTPLNAQEELLYGILIRLDALTNMMSSFMEVYAHQNEIVLEKETIETKPKPKRKSTKK